MRKEEVRPPTPYRRRNGVAFFFRSFCFLFWFFFVLFKEGSLGVSWSELTCRQRDTASGRGKEWVPAMPGANRYCAFSAFPRRQK